ncbi:hypothetical protein KEM55_003305 [Ascosphaera atra]|nr:hypothetical protein KEM55_003305 [Ascosphaera atra]
MPPTFQPGPESKRRLSLGPRQRRTKAAPPGRCHSCSRVETPEWRRGPDGARTLCNACGLHYAKLSRKMNADNKAAAAAATSPQPIAPADGRNVVTPTTMSGTSSQAVTPTPGQALLPSPAVDSQGHGHPRHGGSMPAALHDG